MTSPDGITWTARTTPTPSRQWRSVTYGAGLFVAVATTGTGDRVMTSPDGINWTNRVSSADNNWNDVTFDNGRFVAVANSGTGNRVMISCPQSVSGIETSIGLNCADPGSTGPFPRTGDILQYNSTTGKWENEPGLWDDLRVPVTSTTSGGSNAPLFQGFKNNGAGSKGVFLYYFSQNNEEELYFTAQLPHSYKEGTDIEAHVHYVPGITGATGTVRWGLEYTWSNMNDFFGDTTLVTSDGIITPNTMNKHYYQDIATLSGTGKKISSMLVCRIYRSNTGVTNNYSADVGLMEIDFHFQQCGIGSGLKLTK
jgi:hypothetical protein